ncbi:hypothetical protein DdX_06098 [Ditylenchus destructor]|uniref:Uncharacterized protein n=1 Tax=Ditylenchus destructor TaxID=166010 RepID=A0AAD4N6M5_9BILA|nr:hypothetical protein DdX_06098 [Ditylenchus destructor]
MKDNRRKGLQAGIKAAVVSSKSSFCILLESQKEVFGSFIPTRTMAKTHFAMLSVILLLVSVDIQRTDAFLFGGMGGGGGGGGGCCESNSMQITKGHLIQAG